MQEIHTLRLVYKERVTLAILEDFCHAYTIAYNFDMSFRGAVHRIQQIRVFCPIHKCLCMQGIKC